MFQPIECVCVCVCVRARARVRACLRVCVVRACVRARAHVTAYVSAPACATPQQHTRRARGRQSAHRNTIPSHQKLPLRHEPLSSSMQHYTRSGQLSLPGRHFLGTEITARAAGEKHTSAVLGAEPRGSAAGARGTSCSSSSVTHSKARQAARLLAPRAPKLTVNCRHCAKANRGM